MNKITLIGNLGTDVELKYTPAGRAVANFRMATNEHWNDKDGQKKTRTEWHRITVWGDRAENCAKYLTKGRQVLVEGASRTSMYEKDGEKRYSTYVEARDVQFLGTRREAGDSAPVGEEFGSNDSVADMEVPI
jgi:single-strand DNA-binding protein